MILRHSRSGANPEMKSQRTANDPNMLTNRAFDISLRGVSKVKKMSKTTKTRSSEKNQLQEEPLQPQYTVLRPIAEPNLTSHGQAQ
mmetsp:Transcript_32476/g.103252  ORF Transcript_32476/g.103252 Transcript_32476/m.103252 type:complete len:86 (+) Transcript_32476:579-836(+)